MRMWPFNKQKPRIILEPIEAKGKQGVCMTYGSREMFVVAEAGVGQNVECNKCGSLHMDSPFGWTLLRTGQPLSIVRYKGEILAEFIHDEAFQFCKSWNCQYRVIPGAYVVDSGGVMATDPLYPIT